MHNISEISTTLYAIYNLYYIEKSEITESIYKPFFLWSPFQLLSLSAILSNYIIKAIKLLYNIQEVNIIKFAIYYLYYKD